VLSCNKLYSIVHFNLLLEKRRYKKCGRSFSVEYAGRILLDFAKVPRIKIRELGLQIELVDLARTRLASAVEGREGILVYG